MNKFPYELGMGATLKGVRFARKRLFDMHLRRLIDTSSVFTGLLTLAVIVLWLQSQLDDEAIAHATVVAGMRMLTITLLTIIFVGDATKVWFRPSPIVWPEPGDVMTLSGAPIHMQELARPLRRRAVLFSLSWRWAVTLIIAFIISGYTVITPLGLVITLILITIHAYMREALSWWRFHRSWVEINWSAFAQYGEIKLRQWEYLGIGQWSLVLTHQSRETPDQSSTTEIKTETPLLSPQSSNMYYSTRLPLAVYMWVLLRKTGTIYLLLGTMIVGVIVIHNIGPMGSALFVGLSQVLLVWLPMLTALREQRSLPWFALFPWKLDRLRGEVFLSGFLFVSVQTVILSFVAARSDIPHVGLWFIGMFITGLVQAELASMGVIRMGRVPIEWSVVIGMLPWLGELVLSFWPRVFANIMVVVPISGGGWTLTLLICAVIMIFRKKHWLDLGRAVFSLMRDR